MNLLNSMRCRISVYTTPDQRQSDERLEHDDDQQAATRMYAPGQLHRAVYSLSSAIYYTTWRFTCRHVSYWRCRWRFGCRWPSAQV